MTEKTYFAKVEGDTVVDIIVADQAFIDNIKDSTPGKWVQTWKDGGLRYNFAQISHVYDKIADAFYRRQPFSKWILNTDTYKWEPPIPRPEEGYYAWDDNAGQWVVSDDPIE